MQIYDGRQSFSQWDINQRLTSGDLKVGDILHFYNIKQPKALPLVAYEYDNQVVVDVPNILLQSSNPIFVFRWIQTEDSFATTERYEFQVKQRPKPSDYIYTQTECKTFESLENRMDNLEASISLEGINKAVQDYLKEHPIDTGSPATIGIVELLANKWTGSENLYSQIVNIDGVTENSQVDLTPSVEQLVIFYEKDLTFVTENEDGIVTVYAIGQKPTNDYTIQVTITEVNT